MKKMGRYCKAYPIERFQEFSGWPSGDAAKDQASGRSFYYLQEDFTVTGDIFMDENLIFTDVSPDWIEFCKNTLKFEVPDYQTAAGGTGNEQGNSSNGN